MRLAAFIDKAEPEILAHAVAHARTLRSLSGQDSVVLQDHLPRMLREISAELRGSQRQPDASQPALHARETEIGPLPTAAQSHGLKRAHSGLEVEQVVAEFRALRACVLRLWIEDAPLDAHAVEDILRFDEVLDQALGESVDMYAAEVARWRDIFLGVLGHDLRVPLNAIALTSEVIADATPHELQMALGSLNRSVRRMTALLDSLLEYNRAGLGCGMTLERAPVDLGQCCIDELELQRAAMPQARIEFAQEGDTHGEVDGSRLREALGNLLTNAVRHGETHDPVRLRLKDDGDGFVITVENYSARSLADAEIAQLFEPLQRGPSRGRPRDSSHLGLGLFIARQIARAHGGDLRGECVNQGAMNLVRFTMNLPRQETGRQDGPAHTEPQLAHCPAPATSVG